MSRFAALAGLALRELWISFRLLAVLVILLLAALPVAILPQVVAPELAGAPLDPLAWYATALAAALALVAGLAAGTLSAEARRGTLAWLAVRAVPRATLLLAWFAAFAAVLAIGLTASAVLAWTALGGGAFVAGGMGAFIAASAAVAAVGLTAVSAGLLAGTLLRPVRAALAATVVVGAALLAAALGPLGWAPLPTAGVAVLGSIDDAARPIADALRSSGTALAAAAALLVLAAARLERADL